MDRLSIILTLMTGAVITGTLIVALFTFGFYSWPYIGLAAFLGFGLSWPAAFAISRRIKANDPEWNEKKIEKTDGIIPKAGAKEV